MEYTALLTTVQRMCLTNVSMLYVGGIDLLIIARHEIVKEIWPLGLGVASTREHGLTSYKKTQSRNDSNVELNYYGCTLFMKIY
jgi:hypothetical protein